MAKIIKNPVIAGLIVIGVYGAISNARAETISLNQLVEQFRQVVFFEETVDGAAGKPLTKWTGRVSATIRGAKDHRKAVIVLLKQVSRLTGLKISLALFPKHANLKIYFMPTAKIRERVKQSRVNCAGQFKGSRKTGAIRSAEVYISSDMKHKTVHCISEEIAQVLGLANDTKVLKNSIFNEKSKRKTLSLSDKILMRTLYDKRLKPNMTEKQAMPIAKKVIRGILLKIAKAQKKRPKK